MSIASVIKKQTSTDIMFALSDDDSSKLLKKTEWEYKKLDIKYTDYSRKRAYELRKFLEAYHVDLLFIDSYDLTEDYISVLKKDIKVACFFCKEDKISPNLLINYNVNYNRYFYQTAYVNDACELLLGTEYIPLRHEFEVLKKQNQTIKLSKILFLTGGSDSCGLAEQLIEKSSRLLNYEITIVVGTYSSYKNTIRPQNVKVVEHTNDIAQLMIKSDIVISAGGTTMYELCALGIPAIIYSLADNQTSEAQYMGDNGYVKYIGSVGENVFWQKLIEAVNLLMKSCSMRQAMVKKMRKLVDGKGCERIVKKLKEI